MRVSLTTFLLMHKMTMQTAEHAGLLLHEMSHMKDLEGTSKERELIGLIAEEVSAVYEYLKGLKYLVIELKRTGDEGLLLVDRDPPLHVDGETYGEVDQLIDVTLRALQKSLRALVAFSRGQLEFRVSILQAHQASGGICKISELFSALYVANMSDRVSGPSTD